jgi:hypothetical protein
LYPPPVNLLPRRFGKRVFYYLDPIQSLCVL